MRYGTPRRVEAPHARLEIVGNALAFYSSYDPGLVAELKRRIPPEARTFERQRAPRWLVAPQYGQVCAELARTFLGLDVAVPAIATVPAVETRLLRLEYLGRTKERGNGDMSAFGWSDGSWCIIFPETVLREWFDAIPQAPGEKPTLFGVLMVKPDCTPDALRSAHRRMVKIWHPDVNRSDPDAAEQFKIVQHAWEVLSDAAKRKKYVAGLALQASMPRRTRAEMHGADPFESLLHGYRAPLRCGWVLAEGIQQVARFVVQHILAWEDILNEQGQSLSTSWPMGSDKPEVLWQ